MSCDALHWCEKSTRNKEPDWWNTHNKIMAD